MAQRYEITGTVQQTGAASVRYVANASVQVKDLQGNNLTVYAAETGSSTLANPLTADTAGRVDGWIEAPDFDLTMSGSGVTTYTQKVRQSPAGVFNVKSYGAKGNNSTDDSTAIQAADTAALAATGQVAFPQGTYIATNLTATVSWKGVGAAILKHKASATQDLVTVGASTTDVTISDLEINGNSASQSSNVKGITIGGTRNRVTGCYLHAMKYDGIYVSASALHIGIDNNRIDTTGRFGITIGGNTAGVDEPKYIRITENTVKATNDGGLGIVGIAKHVVFANNIVENTVAGDGIAAYNRDNFNILATGNVIDTTGNHGIHLGGNRVAAVGNSIYNPNFNGVMIASDPNGTPTASARFTVSGNLIDTPGRASSAANGAGVQVEAMSYGSVSGNTVVTPYGHGINLDLACTTVAISGNTVRGSTVGSGIRVSKTTKTTVSGNVVSGNAADGIKVTDDAVTLAADCVITGNLSTGNTGFGINPISTAKVTIGLNHLTSNTGGNINSPVTTASVVSQNLTDTSSSIASAGTLVIPHGLTHVVITGTTTVTGISSASRAVGRMVTLQFAGILTFTDGGNLVLAGNFVTTAADTITLMCDGADWYEVARSVN